MFKNHNYYEENVIKLFELGILHLKACRIVILLAEVNEDKLIHSITVSFLQ